MKIAHVIAVIIDEQGDVRQKAVNQQHIHM